MVREMNSLRHQPDPNPGFRYEEQHRLAAAGRLVKTPLPSLARSDPAVWIEVEENLVFPAFALEPVAQRNGLGIVRARMAQKNARHDQPPRRHSRPKENVKTQVAIVTMQNAYYLASQKAWLAKEETVDDMDFDPVDAWDKPLTVPVFE